MRGLILTLGFVLGATGIASAADNGAGAASPPQCVYPRDIMSTKPLSDREILFTMRNGKVWKNTLHGNCPGLKFEDGFSWNVRGDTVCANLQTLYVLRRGTPCQLGEFSAYTPPPKPAN